jgi:hypothetical protein
VSKATETLEGAMKLAMAGRPKVGGFPYLKPAGEAKRDGRKFGSDFDGDDSQNVRR